MSHTPLTLQSESESESDAEESPLTRNETAPAVLARARQATALRSSTETGVAGYVADFLALPSQVFVMFFLEFLNSYRNFGLRFVQYQYISNEFDMTDVETGSLLGVKSTVLRE